MANQDPITIRSALPADIKVADIYSNEDESKFVDVREGLIRLTYYESILQDTIRVVLLYADSGNTIEKKKGDGERLSAIEGLPIVGQETVELVFEDNNENKIEFTKKGKNNLYVNKVTPITGDTTRSLVMLDLVSKEYILNEKIRLNTRFDGKISTHIEGILTKQKINPDNAQKTVEKNYFKTEKKTFIEETTGEYSFCGDNRKPFYTMNWLSKKAVPGGGKDRDEMKERKGDEGLMGNSAGFFFWETIKGFHFRSIDWLMDKEMNPKKKSIIYTDTSDDGGTKIPEGYDIKALAAEKANALDIQKKLMMGAFSSRTIVFNPFNCLYEVINPNAYGSKPDPKTGKIDPKGPTPKGDQSKLKKAAEKFPVMNKVFDMEENGAGTGDSSNKGEVSTGKDFSRTQYMLIDSGTLIDNGSKDPKKWSEGTTEQLTKCQTQQNFEVKDILSQSSMRYNQLFSSKISVTIPGDLSLHAGDSIFYDGPQLTGSDKKSNIDKKDGGLYIIADICHYITSKDTFTKMNLVRDSTGRTGTAKGG